LAGTSELNTPVKPPFRKFTIDIKTSSIGEVIRIRPPHNVPIADKKKKPVGTDTISVTPMMMGRRTSLTWVKKW
jgi:hypothetical protein